MSKEVLTHSDRYVRKTNRIILIVGIISMLVFLFGLALMSSDDTPTEQQHYVVEDSIEAETNLQVGDEGNLESEIQFEDAEEIERPITMTPNPINMGQVVIGTESTNVLTVGTNSKSSIKIISIALEDVAAEGFTFENNCNGQELRGRGTCSVTMKWLPTMAYNFQNNFKIVWRETNVADKDAKHDEVAVYGNAITKEECNFCDSGSGLGPKNIKDKKNMRAAIGPDGKVIGYIDEDGIVYDESGKEIGRVNADGLVVDKEGNIIGVATNGKLVLDESGNVIGYVDENGVAYDNDGNVIGTMLSDGTVVDKNGKIIGKTVESGYVYDENGNLIGRVLNDGSVVDLDGNVIGKVNADGQVVDANGNIIGRVAKSGSVALDEDGNILGIVMPNGDIVDENGYVVGRVDENGNIIKKNQIGKRGASVQMAVDENGNVIGYIDENGNVRDFSGNVIGKVDKNGNIVDKDGKVIGKASDKWLDLALDEKGNVIGYVDEGGLVRDTNGKVIGYVDENGNIMGNDFLSSEDNVLGYVGGSGKMALDKNGNVIGYIDEDGNVRDFSGNIIGKVDENGNIVDKNGNIMGYVGEEMKLAYNEKGELIGYVDEDGIVRDEKGNIIGIVENGKIKSFGVNKIGSLLDRDLIPITPEGRVLGTVNTRGEVVNNQKIVGKMLPNGLVTDKKGHKILALGVKAGYIADWGCNYGSRLTKEGVIINDGNEVNYRLYADGTVWTPDGEFAGKLIKTGMVFDDECNYLGELEADGYVRNADKREIGCVNPDGKVLALDEPRVIGHTVERRPVYSEKSEVLGVLETNGTLRNAKNKIIGCMNSNGEVADENGAFLGSVQNVKYAFDFKGNLLGMFDDKGKIKVAGHSRTKMLNDNLLADETNNIIGYAVPEVLIIANAESKVLGHLFPDGNIYDNDGVLVDKIRADGYGIYGGEAGAPVSLKQVVDINGKPLGFVNYDMNVITNTGAVVGRVNVKGMMIDENNLLVGGVVKQGGVRGYDGAFLGYAGADGKVVATEETETGDGNIYKAGDVTGYVVPDGYVVKDGSVIGEVLPKTTVVDMLGKYVGFSGALGSIYGRDGALLSEFLPGGANSENLTPTPKGFVIDFKGNVIGNVLANGQFMDLNRNIKGFVLPDGKVINSDSRLIGEVVDADIVIGNDDKLKGFVGIDGRVFNHGVQVGKLLSDGLAVDVKNNVMGHSFSIGNPVLSNKGEYLGRLAANGKVIDLKNNEIGYLKSNGSFVDTDGKAAGYSLPEVAKNRRN